MWDTAAEAIRSQQEKNAVGHERSKIIRNSFLTELCPCTSTYAIPSHLPTQVISIILSQWTKSSLAWGRYFPSH